MNRVRSSDLFIAEDGLTYHGREPFTGVSYELWADGFLASEVEHSEGLLWARQPGDDGQLEETYRLDESSPDFEAFASFAPRSARTTARPADRSRRALLAAAMRRRSIDHGLAAAGGGACGR